MFRKFLSYILPVNIHSQASEINKSLEISWNNGQLVLDTKNTNYSYGSLQRILRKGLLTIGFEKIRTFEKILILGVAGGSVVKTLVNEIKFEGKIIGVELDPDIIKIANTYFEIDKIKSLEIIMANAEDFVRNKKENFDLIIIDIFQDNFMPEFLFEEFFINNVIENLNNNGFIIFNTMILNGNDKFRNDNYCKQFENNDYKIIRIDKLEHYNELIIINKL